MKHNGNVPPLYMTNELQSSTWTSVHCHWNSTNFNNCKQSLTRLLTLQCFSHLVKIGNTWPDRVSGSPPGQQVIHGVHDIRLEELKEASWPWHSTRTLLPSRWYASHILLSRRQEPQVGVLWVNGGKEASSTKHLLETTKLQNRSMKHKQGEEKSLQIEKRKNYTNIMFYFNAF